MSQYEYVCEKLKEYTEIKEEMKDISCDCYAVYKLHLNQTIRQFTYATDYEYEKEAMEYCERVYNLVPSCPDALVVVHVKKNAIGEIILNDFINGTESFIKYNGPCKLVLTNRENPFTWINIHALHAGNAHYPVEAKTKDTIPSFWIPNTSYKANTIVVHWNYKSD